MVNFVTTAAWHFGMPGADRAGEKFQAVRPESVGATVDMSAGTIVVNSLDCADHSAPGVMFSTTSSDPATHTYYGLSNATMLTATDTTGIAAIAPIPAGVVDVTAFPLHPAR